MKRVLILSAVLFLATAFTSRPVANSKQQNAKENLAVLTGYQTHYSALGSYQITVYVVYLTGGSAHVLDVYAEDQWANPVDVTSTTGSITNDFNQLIATNYVAYIDYLTTGDYVTLNGNLTML